MMGTVSLALAGKEGEVEGSLMHLHAQGDAASRVPVGFRQERAHLMDEHLHGSSSSSSSFQTASAQVLVGPAIGGGR